MQMNKSMLAAYQDRWPQVTDVTRLEQRQASTSERWQKLNALVRMAAGLDLLHKTDEKQVTIVRDRWNRLKSLYLAESPRRGE